MAAVGGDLDAVFGAEGDCPDGLDALAWDEIEMKFLLSHGEQKGSFDHGERGADANSGTAAEGEIGETRNFAGAKGILAPALGIEPLRLRKKARIALGKPLKHEDVGARRDAVTA